MEGGRRWVGCCVCGGVQSQALRWQETQTPPFCHLPVTSHEPSFCLSGGRLPGPHPLLHSPPTPGLKRLHALTAQAAYELRVDLEDFDNGTAHAHYGSFGVGLFSVDPEEDGFPLTVAGYSGTAGRAPGGGVRGHGGTSPPAREGRGGPAGLPHQGPALISDALPPPPPPPSQQGLEGSPAVQVSRVGPEPGKGTSGVWALPDP